MWKGENDSSTLRVDPYFLQNGEQNLYFQQHSDPCGRGLTSFLPIFIHTLDVKNAFTIVSPKRLWLCQAHSWDQKFQWLSVLENSIAAALERVWKPEWRVTSFKRRSKRWRVCHPLSLPAPYAVTQIDEYEWSIVYLRNSRANARENLEKRWHAKGNLSTRVVIFTRARIFPSPSIQYLRKKKDYWCSEP